MPEAVSEFTTAEAARAGEWRIEPLDSSETANFTLKFPPSASNRSGPAALADLGLTSASLRGGRHAVRFEIRREAGTFACEGVVEYGRGDGTFRFHADPAYAAAVAQTGMPPLTLRKQVVAAMFDLSSSFVAAIVSIGLPQLTFSQLMMLKMFGTKPEDVRALHADFPAETLDDIVGLNMIGVTPAYVEALRRAHVGGLSADNVSAMRASGVEQSFIEGLAATGHHAPSIDDVIALHRDG
jgi:hypothetical protein